MIVSESGITTICAGILLPFPKRIKKTGLFEVSFLSTTLNESASTSGTGFDRSVPNEVIYVVFGIRRLFGFAAATSGAVIFS